MIRPVFPTVVLLLLPLPEPSSAQGTGPAPDELGAEYAGGVCDAPMFVRTLRVDPEPTEQRIQFLVPGEGPLTLFGLREDCLPELERGRGRLTPPVHL